MNINMNFDQFKKETKPIIENKIKNGVDLIFEKTPELSKIGTKEIYSEYLDNVFPDSKIKDIIYRGVGEDPEFRIKQGTRQTVAPGFVFFAKDYKTAESYKRKIEYERDEKEKGSVIAGVVNAKNILNSPNIFDLRDLVSMKMFAKIEHFNDINIKHILKISDLYFTASLFQHDKDFSTFDSCLKNILKSNENVTEKEFDFIKKFKASHDYRDIDNYLKEYDTITIDKSYDNIDLDPFEQVGIANSNQFHELGTKEDMEKFKDFVYQKTT